MITLNAVQVLHSKVLNLIKEKHSLLVEDNRVLLGVTGSVSLVVLGLLDRPCDDLDILVYCQSEQEQKLMRDFFIDQKANQEADDLFSMILMYRDMNVKVHLWITVMDAPPFCPEMLFMVPIVSPYYTMWVKRHRGRSKWEKDVGHVAQGFEIPSNLANYGELFGQMAKAGMPSYDRYRIYTARGMNDIKAVVIKAENLKQNHIDLFVGELMLAWDKAPLRAREEFLEYLMSEVKAGKAEGKIIRYNGD